MAGRPLLHRWDLTPGEAVALQRELRHLIQLVPPQGQITTIAGADISFNRFSNVVWAGIVVLRLDDLSIIDSVGLRTSTSFPYIPGLLSFREAPPLLEAWSRLTVRPDAIILDGQGIAHPRRFGIACHLGLLLGLPSIGCAKSLLVGRFDDPAPAAGSRSPLIHDGETVGAALRTKDKVRPVFVSPGHLVDIEAAVDLVRRSTTRYRQPEPTRQAHLLVNRLRRLDSGADRS